MKNSGFITHRPEVEATGWSACATKTSGRVLVEQRCGPGFPTGGRDSFKRRRTEQGSVLIVCIGVLAIISMMAVVFITTMRMQEDIGANLKHGIQAKIAARSGLSHALNLLDRHANDDYNDIDKNTSLDDAWFSTFCYVGGKSASDEKINSECFQFDVPAGLPTTPPPNTPKDQNFDPYPTISNNRTLNGVEVNFDGKAKWFECTSAPLEGAQITDDDKVKTRYAVLTIDLSGRLLAPPAAWQPNTEYQEGQVVYPTDVSDTGPAPNREYLCTTAGTSGGSEPDWASHVDVTALPFSEGSVSWQCRYHVQATRLASILESGRIDSELGMLTAYAASTIFKENTYSWLHALSLFGETFKGEPGDPFTGGYVGFRKRLETLFTPFGAPLLKKSDETDLAFGPININTAPRALMNAMILNACGPLTRKVWQRNHEYEEGELVRPSLESGITGVYKCIKKGTSSLNEPDWYLEADDRFGAIGNILNDGSVQWERVGSTFPEWEAEKYYEIGDIIRPRSVNTQDGTRFTQFAFICTASGRSDINPDNEPGWGAITAAGETITGDGSVNWEAIAPLFLPGVEQLLPTMIYKTDPDKKKILLVGDGASTLTWRPWVEYYVGDIVQPTNPKGYYYRCNSKHSSTEEPDWPEDGTNGAGSWNFYYFLPPEWTPN
ncbi:MAG: hypothetical protein JXA52_00270, partial [Planctomycetes bacterium]|nr:hypothetical protein [Planctomycetota bacterium]